MLLLDGAGALLSAGCLGGIAYCFTGLGMPVLTVYGLAGTAAVFAIWSLACYCLAGKKQHACLVVVAVINVLYSVITAGLVISFYQQMHKLGIIYFVSEILVLWILVFFEVRAVLNKG